LSYISGPFLEVILEVGSYKLFAWANPPNISLPSS
jgi:hypothetical protein